MLCVQTVSSASKERRPELPPEQLTACRAGSDSIGKAPVVITDKIRLVLVDQYGRERLPTVRLAGSRRGGFQARAEAVVGRPRPQRGWVPGIGLLGLAALHHGIGG